jgi:hypothetical protein
MARKLVDKLRGTADILFFYKNKKRTVFNQGSHIFLGATYQKGKNTQNVPNGHKMYQLAVKYTKWLENIPISSISRPSKIYPKMGFLV